MQTTESSNKIFKNGGELCCNLHLQDNYYNRADRMRSEAHTSARCCVLKDIAGSPKSIWVKKQLNNHYVIQNITSLITCSVTGHQIDHNINYIIIVQLYECYFATYSSFNTVLFAIWTCQKPTLVTFHYQSLRSMRDMRCRASFRNTLQLINKLFSYVLYQPPAKYANNGWTWHDWMDWTQKVYSPR